MIPEPCDGQLAFDGFSLHRHSWYPTRLIDLWFGGEVRGVDRIVPLQEGAIAYQRRFTVTRHSIPMVILGELDPNGNPYPDIWDGLETNIGLLRAGLVDPTGLGDGTRAGVLTMPSGATRNAATHILGLTPGELVPGIDAFTGREGIGLLATLEISLPSGRFV